MEEFQMMNPTYEDGLHIIAEFYGCPRNRISLVNQVKPLIINALKQTNFRALHKFFYQFTPKGVTGIVALTQSHVSVHTWPEFGFIALDIYSCSSKEEPMKLIELLKKEFKPTKVRQKNLIRRLKKV